MYKLMILCSLRIGGGSSQSAPDELVSVNRSALRVPGTVADTKRVTFHASTKIDEAEKADMLKEAYERFLKKMSDRKAAASADLRE